MEINSKSYILCPVCSTATKFKVIPGITKLTKFPLYCRWCKETYIIDYE